MAPAFNPPADGTALDGLTRGWAHIERAARNGQDREARLAMMSASMQDTLAFQKGLGVLHSLSHSLGGINQRPAPRHPERDFSLAVTTFNSSAESIQKEHRLERMARVMGLPSAADIGAAILNLNARLGLAAGLAARGMQGSQFDTIIAGATADHCHKTNPRIATTQDYCDRLSQAM